MNISNQKILITGGNSGIGLAFVKKLVSLGNHLIVVGRNEKRLQEVKSNFPSIDIFKCDLAKQTDLDALILYLEQNHTDLNILINNAGIQYNYQFLEDKDLIYKVDHEINVNLNAPIKLITLVLPILQQNKNAAIVNVTSGLGLVPKQSAPVYCSTKAGLHIFSKALRYQLQPNSIKVFEVIPPLVETPMTTGRGKNKLTPEALVEEAIRGFKRDKFEINIGKVKLLRGIQRVLPSVADRILMNS